MNTWLKRIAKHKDITVSAYLIRTIAGSLALAVGLPFFKALSYDQAVWGKREHWEFYFKFGLIVFFTVPILVFLFDLDRANRGIRPEDDKFRRR